jgi:hypothetical protein
VPTLTAEQRAERAAAKAAAEAAATENATALAERELAAANAAALDIAAAVAAQDIDKAQRVYVDVTHRVATPSGALTCVQREQRSDGSLGEFLLATVRINERDKSESAQRVSIAQVQTAIDALGASGATLFRAPTAAPA